MLNWMVQIILGFQLYRPMTSEMYLVNAVRGCKYWRCSRKDHEHPVHWTWAPCGKRMMHKAPQLSAKLFTVVRWNHLPPQGWCPPKECRYRKLGFLLVLPPITKCLRRSVNSNCESWRNFGSFYCIQTDYSIANSWLKIWIRVRAQKISLHAQFFLWLWNFFFTLWIIAQSTSLQWPSSPLVVLNLL